MIACSFYTTWSLKASQSWATILLRKRVIVSTKLALYVIEKLLDRVQPR